MKTLQQSEAFLQLREITKTRLIAALLAELDASNATVISECSISQKTYQNTIHCSFKVPFESSLIEFVGIPDNILSLQCHCCYAGQRISFDLDRIESTSWSLPKKIVLSDLRRDSRFSFSKKTYSAEVITQRSSIYGYAVDINRDYLAIDIDNQSNLSVNEDVQVIIRMIDCNIDVFFMKCRLAKLTPLDSGETRLILKLIPKIDNNRSAREHERKKVERASLALEYSTFEDSKAIMNVTIENIGIGGMTIFVSSEADRKKLIPGQILNSKEPKISFLIIWNESSRFGLRALMAESKSFTIWNQYIDLIAPPDDRRSSVTRRELANLLTQSGLLKGSRRTPFGVDLKDHLITDAQSESHLLTQRRIIDDEYGLPVLHVNLKRICESSWLFADGASLIDKKGAYTAMLRACIYSAKSSLRQSSMLPRYLTFIWQKAISVVGEFASEITCQGTAIVVDSCQLSISVQKKIINKPSAIAEVTEMSVKDLSAPKRRKISCSFTPEIFEAFVGFDGSHPILNAELAKFGPYHHTVTKCIQVQNQSIIAHRIKTHSVWSSTGVSNSVFVIVPKDFVPQNLPLALSFLADDAISFGTDDFLLIFDGEEEASQPFVPYLVNPKMFSFLVHDLLLNQALSYKDNYSRENQDDSKKE